MSRPVAAILDDLLAAIAEGCPQAIEEAAAERGILAVFVRVGAEAFGLEIGHGRVRTTSADEGSAVRFEASARAVRDLVLGDDDPVSAVMDGRVALRGSTVALETLDGAVRSIVAGAARVHGTERWLDEFLGFVEREEHRFAGAASRGSRGAGTEGRAGE